MFVVSRETGFGANETAETVTEDIAEVSNGAFDSVEVSNGAFGAAERFSEAAIGFAALFGDLDGTGIMGRSSESVEVETSSSRSTKSMGSRGSGALAAEGGAILGGDAEGTDEERGRMDEENAKMGSSSELSLSLAFG